MISESEMERGKEIGEETNGTRQVEVEFDKNIHLFHGSKRYLHFITVVLSIISLATFFFRG